MTDVEIPQGEQRVIAGQIRVYYDGYWIKKYDVPADTLLAKKRLIEALTHRLFNHVEYGLNVPGTEPLHQSQLESTNPYNTRNPAIKGLTPTPIANPGLASMQAAAHPANVDYLFFVRKPDRIHHFFTASDTEFENYKNAHGFG